VVAVHQLRQLSKALVAFAGKHHPDVLHRRPHAAVIQIDQIKGVVAGEDVAWMAIAMQADRLEVGLRKYIIDPLEQIARPGSVSRQQALRDEVAVQQRGQGVVAEALRVEGLAVFEGTAGADRMHASEQLPEAVELVEIARLGCPPATPGEQRKAKTCMLEQGLAVTRQRSHHGNFPLGQFQAELVLFEDGLVAPAVGTVELRNQRCFVLDAHLINAVFIAVQCQYPRITDIAGTLHGIEHKVRRESVKGMAHGRLREWADQCIAAAELNKAEPLAVGPWAALERICPRASSGAWCRNSS